MPKKQRKSEEVPDLEIPHMEWVMQASIAQQELLDLIFGKKEKGRNKSRDDIMERESKEYNALDDCIAILLKMQKVFARRSSTQVAKLLESNPELAAELDELLRFDRDVLQRHVSQNDRSKEIEEYLMSGERESWLASLKERGITVEFHDGFASFEFGENNEAANQ